MNLVDFLQLKKQELALKGQLTLSCKVKTHAGRSNVDDLLLDQQTLKISLKAAPVEGKANAELMGLLAETFGVTKNQIEIIRGATSGMKLLRISL